MRLRYSANLRSLAFVAAYYGLARLPVGRGAAVAGLALPLLAATCVLSFLCAVITHNSIHSPVFRETSA